MISAVNTPFYTKKLQQDGFVVVNGVFTPEEVALILQAIAQAEVAVSAAVASC